MIEITVISGKGGTGKTSLTAAFAHLAANKVICDLDVDAPDLHLLVHPEREATQEFVAGQEAIIDPDGCDGCGQCLDRCAFGALSLQDGRAVLDPLRCEGCLVCVHFCPRKAIAARPRRAGQWFRSRTRFGPLVHAQLFPGQENSGLLVALLRRQAKELAERDGLDLILSDGAPGIGCPVISSLSNTTLAVAVTEPTPSGRHDLERVAELAGHFKVPLTVIINKCDLQPENGQAIEAFCRSRSIPVAARLPYDNTFTEALIQGRTITEYLPSGLAESVRRAWEVILGLAKEIKDRKKRKNP